jgi:hypothetical protein
VSVLSNVKHERFAQALAKGASAAEAYVRAGYKPNDGNAIRLKGNERVAERVAELSERIAEKAEWSAVDRLRMLAEIANSTVREDPRIAVSAIAEANKMQGSHAPVRQDHLSSDGSMTPRPDHIIIEAAGDDGKDQLAGEIGPGIQ